MAAATKQSYRAPIIRSTSEYMMSNTAGGDGVPHTPPRTPREKFLLPSPIPTRRSRTYSMNERVKTTPMLKGIVKDFCRQRGHGFIVPNDGSDPLFVHISDIDGEYVPKEGDEVTYKQMLIPPKNEKHMAVHVTITHLKEGVTHETWESVVPKTPEHGTPGS